MTDSVPGIHSERPAAEVFSQLLDAIVTQLAPENAAALELPSDELHQEILLPLLPSMLADRAIRDHWRSQKSTGFFARLQSHLAADAPRPRWNADDFEIHVTASYSAGPDARALADTLLSEDSLRDLAAALMNQVLEPAWAQLPTREAAPLGLVAATEAEMREEPAEIAQPEPEFAAAATAERWLIGMVTHSRPVRPQPWKTRINPVAAARGAVARAFPNPLARNPLEQRSEPRHVWKTLDAG